MATRVTDQILCLTDYGATCCRCGCNQLLVLWSSWSECASLLGSVRRESEILDLAVLLGGASGRLPSADLASAVRAVSQWVALEVSPSATSDLAAWLGRLARAHPVAPMLATVLEIARKQGWDQRLIEAMAEALVEALERPDFRTAVGDLVDEVLAGYRAQMSLYPRFLIV